MVKHSQGSTKNVFAIAAMAPALLTGIFSTQTAQASSTTDIHYCNDLLTRAEPGQDMVRVGDMRLKASALRNYRDKLSSPTSTRAAIHPWTATWPGGVVPYAYEASVSSAHRVEFEAALRQWQLVANLKFVPRTTEVDYITVASGYDGNWSWVGKVGGAQELHIQQWSDTGIGSQAKYLICHEIGHALGFIHEQSREDRDNYVAIHSENVDTETFGPDAVYNFDIVPGSLNQGAYDFDSVMHYRKDTFAQVGAVTIEAQPAYSGYQDVMGQLNHLSALDKSGMAKIYGAARVISGYVRTDSGVALSGTTLRIAASSPYRAANPVLNATNGSYAFKGLPSDTHTVTATKTGFFMLPSVQSVSIAQANKTAIDFIALQGTRISGRITKSGVGVPGVAVTSRNLATGALVTVMTSKQGYYGFSNVPTGAGVSYRIEPSKTGYSFSTTTVMPLNESTPTNYDNVNFTGAVVPATRSTEYAIGPSGTAVAL